MTTTSDLAHEIFVGDNWLSQVTGLACFALRSSDTAGTQRLVEAAAGRAAFFTAKVPVAEVERLDPLLGAGFRIVDTHAVFECASGEFPEAQEQPDVRPGTAQDATAVAAIAASCFQYTRFHLDPRFSDALADRIKGAWAANYFARGRGEEILVAFSGGRPAGFLAVLLTQERGKKTAVIDLIGVDRALQGGGIGARLTVAFAARWRGRTARLRVGTQLANVAAIRLYERCGFRLTGASYVLHAHVRDGKVAA